MMNGVVFNRLIDSFNNEEELKPLVKPLEELSNISDELVVFVEKTFPKINAAVTTCLGECRGLIGIVEMGRLEDNDVKEMLCDINALVATFKKVQELTEIDDTWDMKQFLEPIDEPDVMLFTEFHDIPKKICDQVEFSDVEFMFVSDNTDVESVFGGSSRDFLQIKENTWLVTKSGEDFHVDLDLHFESEF